MLLICEEKTGIIRYCNEKILLMKNPEKITVGRNPSPQISNGCFLGKSIICKMSHLFKFCYTSSDLKYLYYGTYNNYSQHVGYDLKSQHCQQLERYRG